MTLYHGSTVPVDNPKIISRTSFLDFGTAFYTTSSYQQAERWAQIKMRRDHVSIGYISSYRFDLEAAQRELSIVRFDTADAAWLQFVVSSRRGERPAIPADLYIGPVADDTIYQTIRLFEAGAYNAEETIKRLKTEVLHDQWAFCTEKALSFCTFLRSEEQKGARK